MTDTPKTAYSDALIQKVVDYLMTRPMGEVLGLFSALQAENIAAHQPLPVAVPEPTPPVEEPAS